MRRSVVAAAWILGATVPLLASVVFIFGCCVLPFHRYIHKVVPLCNVAIGLLHGEDDHQDRQQPLPARAKQEPAKRIAATHVPRTFNLAASSTAQRYASAAAKEYRSFISLGALRCDRDVGLHLLVRTLLI